MLQTPTLFAPRLREERKGPEPASGGPELCGNLKTSGRINWGVFASLRLCVTIMKSKVPSTPRRFLHDPDLLGQAVQVIRRRLNLPVHSCNLARRTSRMIAKTGVLSCLQVTFAKPIMHASKGLFQMNDFADDR